MKQLVEGTPGEMAKYIHWGATTQDIMDDASMLQMKRGLKLVGRELQTLVGVLKGLAEKYRDTYVYIYFCGLGFTLTRQTDGRSYSPSTRPSVYFRL